MIIRLLIFIALASLVILIYRKFTATQSPPTKPTPDTMKKCRQCGVHLPEKEAIKHNNDYFCSEEHKTLFLNDSNND